MTEIQSAGYVAREKGVTPHPARSKTERRQLSASTSVVTRKLVTIEVTTACAPVHCGQPGGTGHSLPRQGHEFSQSRTHRTA